MLLNRSAYTPCGPTWDPIAVQSTLEAIDILQQIVKKYTNKFMIATTAESVKEAFRNGKIASLIGSFTN
jgi:membrane dipeptidase